jgi:hypothetical protein
MRADFHDRSHPRVDGPRASLLDFIDAEGPPGSRQGPPGRVYLP